VSNPPKDVDVKMISKYGCCEYYDGNCRVGFGTEIGYSFDEGRSALVDAYTLHNIAAPPSQWTSD
jgi:hypothetical protein